jgi:hypothetical protein
LDLRATRYHAMPANGKIDVGPRAGACGVGGIAILVLHPTCRGAWAPGGQRSARAAPGLLDFHGDRRLDWQGRCRLHRMRMHTEGAHGLPCIDAFLDRVEALVASTGVATHASAGSGPAVTQSAGEDAVRQASTHQVSKVPTVRPRHTRWYRYPLAAGARLGSPRKGGRHQYFGSRSPR